MLSFVLFTFFLLSLFCILFIVKKIIACLLKGKNWRKKMYENQKQTKKCWGYPKHLFELLVIAIACVQKYIFYEKKAKTKKIILTPCAIKLSFIRHGFCHSQQVYLHIISVFFNWHLYWINRQTAKAGLKQLIGPTCDRLTSTESMTKYYIKIEYKDMKKKYLVLILRFSVLLPSSFRGIWLIDVEENGQNWTEEGNIL